MAAGNLAKREAELPKLVGAIVASRYRVERLIGAGGMGAVYAAEHLTTGRKVALKLVDREFADDELTRARFHREIRAMSAIESEHIPAVLDAGTHDDGRPFLVMDLLSGEDLGERLHRDGRVPWREACAIVAQILRGLAHAHAAGVVHRDLKPDNVFLTARAGQTLVKILDFGVSKFQPLSRTTLPLALTARGVILGTPFYIAPEQARGESDVDARSDLYSAGAILFECLAGRPPHVGERYEQVMLSACTTDAPDVRRFDPALPVPLASFVARALARARADRWPSARDMLAALAEVAPEAQLALEDAPKNSARPRASRASLIPWYATRWPVLATGVIAAAVGAGIAALVFARPTPAPLPPPPRPVPTIARTDLPSLAPPATVEVPAVAPTAPPRPLAKPSASTLDIERTLPP